LGTNLQLFLSILLLVQQLVLLLTSPLLQQFAGKPPAQPAKPVPVQITKADRVFGILILSATSAT